MMPVWFSTWYAATRSRDDCHQSFGLHRFQRMTRWANHAKCFAIDSTLIVAFPIIVDTHRTEAQKWVGDVTRRVS